MQNGPAFDYSLSFFMCHTHSSKDSQKRMMMTHFVHVLDKECDKVSEIKKVIFLISYRIRDG